MSSVWRAHDDELDRDVAIKTLAPTADRARFQREARAVAALSHPNICNLYDYGEADGKPYMVLEYLPGGTLAERLAGGKPLPDDDTAQYATEIAAGLAHAHAHGVVHRDLKPANVLFDGEGRAKIADFGIARMGDTGTLTEAGTVLGTAAYISPEQASGLPATAASDVYSFGVSLFRMLTGRLPFISDNAMELVRMNRDEPPPAVADIRPDAPPLLASTADAALAKDPEARPRDGAALLAALANDEATAATMVLPASGGLASAPGSSRRPHMPAMIVLALVLLLGGAALALALAGVGGGSSGRSPGDSGGHITLPSVPSVATTQTTTAASTTTPATSTAATTTRETTTSPTTTAHTTTARTTTARTTTAHTTTAHTTTAPATTTYPTTTSPTTTYATTTFATTTDTTSTVTTTTAAATTGP
jgi:eukaryotic-like serine/threonine-protein kinase